MRLRLSRTNEDVDAFCEPTRVTGIAKARASATVIDESRAFVLSCCVFQRASSYPDDVQLGEGDELIGRGGSAILGPDGAYLAGPLWDEEGILYAQLDPPRALCTVSLLGVPVMFQMNSRTVAPSSRRRVVVPALSALAVLRRV